MSVSRSGSTLSPYYVYKAVAPTSLGFGNKASDGGVFGVTMAASASIMIASSSGTASSDIWYTSDAKNWTRSTSAASVFGSNGIFSMCFGSGIFVAVGENAVIATSTDGSTWTARTKSAGHGASATFLRVYFLNGKFFIWDSNGYLSKSTDGITWTDIGSFDVPNDGNGSGGSATIIENTSNSALYMFPDKHQVAGGATVTKYSFTRNDFTNYTNFSYHVTNGSGARFAYARNVNGSSMFIAMNGRTDIASPENMGANQIDVALTTVSANTYGNNAGYQFNNPAIWPTMHKVPTLSVSQTLSNAGARDIPAVSPLFNGSGTNMGGFWVNYENGYWNLIGNLIYQYGTGVQYASLGCMNVRWKDEEQIVEAMYNVSNGARYAGSANEVSGTSYNFTHRTTQTNGGNEVIFKDVVYIPAGRGTSNYKGRDIIVGRRKILTRNQL
jgi:hypothetical protein